MCQRQWGLKDGDKTDGIGASNLSPHMGGQSTCFISYDCQGSVCKGRVHLPETETKLAIIYTVSGRSTQLCVGEGSCSEMSSEQPALKVLSLGLQVQHNKEQIK